MSIEGVAGPLLTAAVQDRLRAAAAAGSAAVECSLDLNRSITTVTVDSSGWNWKGRRFPYFDSCKDRTIYYWSDGIFKPIARFTTSLIKLVPTDWGPPTFEIDGIKMLPTAHVSPYEDAMRKVDSIQPRNKIILDTCGGLGYFAAWCLQRGAARILSFEKNSDVVWLRSLNPWSPAPADRLTLKQADVVEEVVALPSNSIDAVLHDPPRFGIAGELYSQVFYAQLARVLKRNGKMFHYTGAPNKLSSGRNLGNEVSSRLQRAGFTTELSGDGILAVKKT